MRFQCEHCEQIVSIDDSECGQSVGCGYCGNVTMVPATRVSPKALINDFVIRDTLGSGGMGTVYLAHQISLDRPVALKILLDQFAHNSEFIVDFVREARAAARLNHPNIVQSYAVGEDEGIYFFAMEYVEGRTLKSILTEAGKLDWKDAFKIIQQIAEALDFAWKNQQLVHRDIKPDNIMLTKRDVAKLADLGLARAASETSDDDDEVMGTPQYICPEQLLGQPMDVRGDIYSLGATLFHAVTGNFPFEGNSAADIARKHLNAPIPEPRDFDQKIPTGASYVVKRMMAKRLEDRYEDADELVVDMGLVLRGQKPVGMKSEGGAKKKPTKTKMKTGRLPAVSVIKPQATGRFSAAKGSSSTASRRSTAGPKQIGTSGKASATLKAAPTKPPTGESQPMSSGKIKSTRLKSTRASAPAQEKPETKETTSSYRRPGDPAAPQPKKKGGIPVAVIILIVVIVIILGCVGWFFSQLTKYGFETAEQNHTYYLYKVALDGEREAYQTLKNYSKSEYSAQESEKVMRLANEFVEKYPDSLFTRKPSSLKTVKSWAILYKVPMEMELLADKLHVTGSEWIGEITNLRNTAFTQEYVLSVRDEYKKIETVTITQNEAKYYFDECKIQVWADLSIFSDEYVASYERKERELASQMQSNQSTFTDEKVKIRTGIINETTKCDSEGFATAKLYLRRRSSNAEWLSVYSRRVKNSATALLAQPASETDEVKAKLNEFKGRFLKHVDGGTVTYEELKNAFEANINDRDNAVRAKIAQLPGKERSLKEERDTWLKNYAKALESGVAYFKLVAGTGIKFGPGWDKKHDKPMESNRNLSNISTDLARKFSSRINIIRNGWQPKSRVKIEDVQVWVQSVSKEKFIVQFRRYNNEMQIVPSGNEDIPHWHAVNLGLFHYFAQQVKSSDFENEHLCFEFFFRPAWFKKLTEDGGSGNSVEFLKGETDKVIEVWKPAWAKKFIYESKRGIVKNPASRRIYIAKLVRDILGTTEEFQAERDWFSKLLDAE